MVASVQSSRHLLWAGWTYHPLQPAPQHGNTALLLLQGWFDDRVEARNALSKLPALEQNQELDRRELPWTNSPEERPERIDVLMGCNTRTFKG